MPWFGLAVLAVTVLLIYFWNDLVLKKTRVEFCRAAVLLGRKKLAGADGDADASVPAAEALAAAERSYREAAENFRRAVSHTPGRELARAMRLDLAAILAPPDGVSPEASGLSSRSSK